MDFFEIFWDFLRGTILNEFFGRSFLGIIFYENFFGRIFLRGFFGRIFWEDFLGRIFLGGIFERNSLFTLLRSAKLIEYGIWKELMFLSRFWGKQGRRKKDGQKFRSLEVRGKLMALKNYIFIQILGWGGFRL